MEYAHSANKRPEFDMYMPAERYEICQNYLIFQHTIVSNMRTNHN